MEIPIRTKFRHITEVEIRNAQYELLQSNLDPNNKEIIDGIISYFILHNMMKGK